MDIQDPIHRNAERDHPEFDENDDNNIIDDDTRKFQIRQYNECKNEAQEQMKLLSTFI